MISDSRQNLPVGRRGRMLEVVVSCLLTAPAALAQGAIRSGDAHQACIMSTWNF